MTTGHPLEKRVAGRVRRAGDEGYDSARSVWNGMVDRHPAVIVGCTGPADVAAALRYGAAAGLEIGVRCGGHSGAGHAGPGGGVVLDLPPMNAGRVDAHRRRAGGEGGAVLGAPDGGAR